MSSINLEYKVVKRLGHKAAGMNPAPDNNKSPQRLVLLVAEATCYCEQPNSFARTFGTEASGLVHSANEGNHV